MSTEEKVQPVPQVSQGEEGAAVKNAEARGPVDQFLGQITVTLGGKEIVIPLKTIEETGEYGALIGSLLGEAFGAIEKPETKADKDKPDKDKPDKDKPDKDKPDKDKADKQVDKKQMWSHVFSVLMGSGVPILRKLLYAYHPLLKDAGGSEREILKAALGVVRVTYPLYQEISMALLEMAGTAGVNVQEIATKAANRSGRR